MTLSTLHKAFKCCVVAVVLLLAYAPTVRAASLEITAVFRPDPVNPNQNQFINTTPNRAFCATFPAHCASLGIHSLAVPITFQSNGPILANHASPRQGAMFKVPSAWRTLQVTNTDTGETATVEVRIAGIGSTYYTTSTVSDITGGGSHSSLWNGSWGLSAPSPCTATSWNSNSARSQNFFWLTPPGDYVCAKQAKFDILERFTYNYANTGLLLFAYQLRTPNPLKMSAGNYRGTLTYGVGPGQDFDMGDVMVASDSAITLNFNLDVDHILKVEVPPGGNRVELVPQGGWQAWLNQGRKPTRLFRDQTFSISASSRFKMSISCNFNYQFECALRSDQGKLVAIRAYVTLPNGLFDINGQPINRRRLQESLLSLSVQPTSYIDRKPGTLHFEIAQSQVEEMLASGDTRYNGTITVVWDSEV